MLSGWLVDATEAESMVKLVLTSADFKMDISE